MFSMTGYGKAEYRENGISLTVEIKTVNNRNFDFTARVPRAFISFEDLFRKTVSEYVSRGRVELFVSFSDMRETEGNISVNIGKALDYFKASKEISDKLGIANDCTVSSIMKMQDVLVDNTATDYSDMQEVIKHTTVKACENLNAMRKIEGDKLIADMLNRMDVISDLVETIKTRAPFVATEYKDKLKSRIEEALNDVKYDEARLLNEVAFYTDKVNIDEELTRLGSHISQFRSIIKTQNSGKKLDFLMQEFNRESNTICSKSNDIVITNTALSLKNEIEKVREQVQNLE